MIPVVIGVTIIVFFLDPPDPGRPGRTMLGVRATDRGGRRAARALGAGRAALASSTRLFMQRLLPRRPRRVALLPRAGERADRRPAPGDAVAARVRRRCSRCSSRCRSRRSRRRRKNGARDQVVRAVPMVGPRHAAVLGRDHAHPAVRPETGLVPGRRLRRGLHRAPPLDVPAEPHRRARDLADPRSAACGWPCSTCSSPTTWPRPGRRGSRSHAS